jgi:hypothetical protein
VRALSTIVFPTTSPRLQIKSVEYPFLLLLVQLLLLVEYLFFNSISFLEDPSVAHDTTLAKRFSCLTFYYDKLYTDIFVTTIYIYNFFSNNKL